MVTQLTADVRVAIAGSAGPSQLLERRFKDMRSILDVDFLARVKAEGSKMRSWRGVGDLAGLPTWALPSSAQDEPIPLLNRAGDTVPVLFELFSTTSRRFNGHLALMQLQRDDAIAALHSARGALQSKLLRLELLFEAAAAGAPFSSFL